MVTVSQGHCQVGAEQLLQSPSVLAPVCMARGWNRVGHTRSAQGTFLKGENDLEDLHSVINIEKTIAMYRPSLSTIRQGL